MKKFWSTAAPGRTVILSLLVVGICLTTAIALLFLQGARRDAAIDALATANMSNERAVENLCKNRPKDPACRKAEKIPSTAEIIDEAEIQEPEINDPDPDDPETQDPEQQDPERQDNDPNDPDPDNPEQQEPEQQDPEIDDPEQQDPEIDDPDPNSILQFAVDDSCQPPEGETITDVGLQVERGEGTITYIITCQTAPVTPGP